MKTTKTLKHYRQGDVLLIAVTAAALVNAKAAPREGGRVVLAHGETTGHAHAINEAGVELLVLDDRAEMGRVARELLESLGYKTEIRDEEVVGFLELTADVTVVHEEHATIPLDKGETFLVVRQRQYTPERIEQVAD